MARLMTATRMFAVWVVTLLLGSWVAGVAVGVGYWAIRGWVLGIALSWIVPGFGILSVLRAVLPP